MLEQKDLQAIAQLMDMKLSPINQRLDTIDQRLGRLEDDVSTLKEDVTVLKDDVSILKEDSVITRNGVNTILDWADDASIQVVPLFGRKAK